MKFIVPLIVALVVAVFAFTGGAFTGTQYSQSSVDKALEQAQSADVRVKEAEAKTAKAELREDAALSTAKNLNITTKRLLRGEQAAPQPDQRNTRLPGPIDTAIASRLHNLGHPDGINRYCLLCKDSHPARQHSPSKQRFADRLSLPR